MFEKMLHEVVTTYGPTSREQKISDLIRSYVTPWCDEVKNDALGNLIAFKKGTSGKKVMLSAHMDQIGLIVTDIDENGFLRVSNVGGVSPVIACATHFVFENGTRGVTYFETEKKKLTEIGMTELFMDIGATTREEAEEKVGIGDIATYLPNFVIRGNRVSTPYLDNRVCCYILMEALKNAKTNHDLYVVFTVQEEVGLRGAGPAAYAIEPDFALNLDVCGAGCTPKCARQSVRLGNGPTIKVMDSSVIVPAPVRKFLEDVAKENGIPYQFEILRGGGTDTGAIQRTRTGIVAGCVSIPTRYIHTPVETADLNDIENAIRLAGKVLEQDTLPVMPR